MDHKPHHVPDTVGTALLILIETIADTYTPTDDAPMTSTLGACPHGTPDRPCCAACATLQVAEAVLAEAQGQGALIPLPDAFPRSLLEQQVLTVLQLVHPVAFTPRQVAEEVQQPCAEVRTVLQALATLGTVERPHRGYYRYRPPA